MLVNQLCILRVGYMESNPVPRYTKLSDIGSRSVDVNDDRIARNVRHGKGYADLAQSVDQMGTEVGNRILSDA